MKKRIIISFFIAVFCMALSLPSFASSPRLVDEADLLTSSEETELLEKLDEISERQDCDIVVVTVDSLEGKSAMAYADDYYDYNGYRYDGILLLLSMADRDWYVSTKGYGISAITDAGLDYMSDKFVPYLSEGEYSKAFETYADLCDDYITHAKDGNPYDTNNKPKEKPGMIATLGSLVAGLIAAVTGTGTMKSKLKSVSMQNTASDYVRNGSMNVTDSREIFLYTHIDRVEKPREERSGGGSSTHVSSSGSTHGGGGGKF